MVIVAASKARVLYGATMKQKVRPCWACQVFVHGSAPVVCVRPMAQNDAGGGGLSIHPGYVYATRLSHLCGDCLVFEQRLVSVHPPMRQAHWFACLARPPVDRTLVKIVEDRDQPPC